MSHVAREDFPTGPLSAKAILCWSLPDLAVIDRMMVRGIALIGRAKIRHLDGLEYIAAERDPFILAANHNTRLEAILLPALLFLLRHGRLIHFMADWNFRMIPGVDLLYRRAGAITVARKPARPRLLNVMKPLFTDLVSPMEQARAHLIAGRSIGVFPEGTVNRDPLRLLRGRYGAARLSLETGAPVIPVGLRFLTVPRGAAIPEGSPMSIVIGEPLIPPAAATSAAYADLRAWHERVMVTIGRLSGKSWEFSAQEASHENA
jgi:1-acyl-sn-glycerol-3-phosphate acyltransferase